MDPGCGGYLLVPDGPGKFVNDIKTYDFLTHRCLPADRRGYVTRLFPKALDVIVESTDRDSIL